MHYKGFTLDPFQEEAIKAIDSNNSVVVSAPTGSGKTLIADYIINRDIKQDVRVIYTAPIKALSNQKFKEFTSAYGEGSVGLLTGDVVKNPGAKILIMTTEIYRNMAITNDPALHDVTYVIFDEIHFINDIERGTVWEESIIFSGDAVRFLCLSATIPNAEEFASWISAIKGHTVQVIRHDIRPVPLHVHFFDSGLGITTLREINELANIPTYEKAMGHRHQRRERPPAPSHIELIKDIKDKLPCLFFSFSRDGCQRNAVDLARKRILPFDQRIPTLVREKLKDAPKEIGMLPSTRMLRETLPFGIAFHHAGLLPIIKELVEDLFAQGMIKVLYTTETFAVGINMPAKSVCFESLRKFDGRNFRLLNAKEFFQIAGRAGRRGIDTEGFVFVMLNQRDLEYEKIKKLTSIDDEPIISQFRLSVNTVLNLIKQHTPAEIEEILCKSFHSFQKWGDDFDKMRSYRSHASFEKIVKLLHKMGYLHEDKLTGKGEFSSRIYADELLLGEMFATEFCLQLDEYQTLLVLAAVCYEGRESTEFHRRFPSRGLRDLKHKLRSHPFLVREARFRNLEDLTALINPAFNGKTLFDVLANSNLLEGDLIRFFRQITDRANQIKGATGEPWLVDRMKKVQDIVDRCLKDIDVI